MKYSPLVERYLKTHKYETMNNVRGWKMLLTQRTEAHKEVDKKFKAFKQMAHQAEISYKKMDEEYQQRVAEIKAKLIENEKKARKHIENLEESKLEKLNNGGYAEYANMIVSIFKS